MHHVSRPRPDAPLLFVCIDAGDERVATELMDAGRMPALRAVRDRGSSVVVDTVADELEHCVWPPMVSGRPVGDYAVPFFYIFEPKTMGLTFRREADVDLEPFWLHLPDRGHGALVLDMPDLHPNPESLADETCCWHEHAPPHKPFFTTAALERTLRSFGPPPALDDPDYRGEQSLDHDRAVSDAFAASARFRGAATLAASAGRSTVCLTVHEAHVVHHWLGHHYDQEHWWRPYEPDPELVFRPYEAMDAALAPLLRRFEHGHVVVAMSSGIRPGNRAGHLLEGLLDRAGFLSLRTTRGGSGDGAGQEPVGGGARGAILGALRTVAQRVIPEPVQHRLVAQKFRSRYVWERTRAFPLPNWNTGFVRLNVAGREREGIVPPEAVEDELDAVTRLIMETRDADTGRPLARQVVRAHQAFPGIRVDRLPDLIVAWAGDRPVYRAAHPELGEWSAEIDAGHLWTNHRAGGLVLLAGPRVRPANGHVDGDFLGFAPTVLALNDIRTPSIMRGEVWSDVLVS